MYVDKAIQMDRDMRSPLQRASRDELYFYAKAKGVTEITEEMYMGAYAADKMRKILESKGLTDIKTVNGPLDGTNEQPSGKPPLTVDDLINQPTQPLAPRVTPTINHGIMTRAELAKQCKQRGIKMQRTDSKEKLIERLNGEQNAA